MTISSFSYSQTYFAISQINIEPEYPTTDDSIRIHLIGYLTETGVIIDNVEVLVQDNEVFLTINVHSSGGFQMLIDHTETINLGLLASGDYHINISGEHISDNVSDPSQYHFTVEEATGILSQTSNAKFSVYPNPAKEYTEISYSLPFGVDHAILSVYDASGRLVEKKQLISSINKVAYNTSNLPSGSYTIEIKTNDYSYSIKLIVQ